MDRPFAQAARQAKSKARIQRYEELCRRARNAGPTTRRSSSRSPSASATRHRFRGPVEGLWDKLLIDGLSFKLPPGGIVGVIGPNGAGKTTLFKMITGQDKPDSGTIKIGESVTLGYVDQSRDSLDDKKNVWEEISGGNDILYLGKREINSRAYCSPSTSRAATSRRRSASLSGGERNRVHLAKMLKAGSNVLLLDEPTNDLDVDTLRALEEALEDSPAAP
jgi:ATPase subunit of ABC transporter with duplicated ATPase domains